MEGDTVTFSPRELQQLKKHPPHLPLTRGPKQFAPDNSDEQQREINTSIDEHINVLKEERITRKGNISTGVWNAENAVAEITKEKGSYWNYFGRKVNGKMMLNAEEALFLIEQGSLELYYGGIPLSVQQAFAMLLPCTFPLHHYLVYAYLLRLGYVVIPHQSRSVQTKEATECSTEENSKTAKEMQSQPCKDGNTDEAILLNSPVSHLWLDDNGCQPLVRPRDAISTAAVLSKLQVVKTHRMNNTTESSTRFPTTQHIDFDVYHPGVHFKKSDPGTPALCVSVCRYSVPPPSYSVVSNLTQECHPVPLKFAVTCEGTVSFYGFIDADVPTYITTG